MAELRDAIANAAFGQGLGDGHVTRRLFELGGVARPTVERPGARDDTAVRDLPGLAAAAAAGPEEVLRAAARATGPDAAVDLADDAGRAPAMSVYLGGVAPEAALSVPASSTRFDPSSPYVVLGDPWSGLVVDARTKSVMPGAPGDYPELGAGPDDVLELDGDFSAGFAILVPTYIERLFLRGGYDYNLIADDDSVGTGKLLVVDALPLRTGNRLLFDGSAESDGRFSIFGSDSDDVIFGGHGDDQLRGMGGADTLSGGGGRDVFIYFRASDSTGAGFDILADFDPAKDRINVRGQVTGFDPAVLSGALSVDSAADDLDAALAGLGARHAMLFTPDSGDLAGTVFLVVDGNGVEGYQEGEDYVFALPATSLADLSAHPDFFV